MAIEKRFIHFKKFSDFNSKKLSANEANTQYTIGVSGEIQNGSPDVLYQSYVWIKDTKQQWTHGQLYDGTDSGVKVYTWNWDGSDSGTLTEEEYHGIKDADVVYLTSMDHSIISMVKAEYNDGQITLNMSTSVDLGGGKFGLASLVIDILPDLTYLSKTSIYSIPTHVSQLINDSDFVSSSSLKTINGESILGEGDLTVEGDTDIIVTNKSDLDELYKDVPEGTKAVVVKKTNDLLGVNFFDLFTGTVEGLEEVVANYEAYTVKISSVDTSVELPISDTADVRVELPFADKIYIEMGSDLASVHGILVQRGYSETVWIDGHWIGVSYLIGNEVPLSKLLSIDDNAMAGLTAIAPALIVDFVGAKTITEYVKNGDNWEVWSEGESILNDKLNKWADIILQQLPTKTSQLENDSNFVTSDNIKTINGESILGSGDITIEGESLTESDIAAMGFTKNTGTYSKPSGGIPKSDLESEVQTSLGKADNSLQVEIFGDMELIALNGFEGRGAGLLYALPHEATGDEDDVLASKNTLKTINGESLVGNGNISLPSEVTESTVSGWGFTKNTGTITGIKVNNTSVATSGVANIPAASTSAYGVTKLTTLTNSSSTTLAATASAVKSAYDLANGRQEKLVSGTNIKTINNTSILGSGNITITTDANIQAVDTQETLDDVNTNTYVKYVAQTLTEEQKAQVRENIGVNDFTGSSSKQIITVESGAYLHFLGTNPMIPNAIYIVMGTINALQLEDTGFVDDSWFATQYNNGDVYAEYTIIFTYTDDCYFMLPDYILWANGTFPTLEDGVRYELSIAFTILNNTNWIGQAVIVPFKAV